MRLFPSCQMQELELDSLERELWREGIADVAASSGTVGVEAAAVLSAAAEYFVASSVDYVASSGVVAGADCVASYGAAADDVAAADVDKLYIHLVLDIETEEMMVHN